MVNAMAWFVKFSEMGEAWVRDTVDQPGGFNEQVRPLALTWLSRRAEDKANEEAARLKSLNSKQTSLQARAADAAERAASAAEDAAASAREANEVARDSNSLAAAANSSAAAANNLAREANRHARYAWIASAISAIVAILALALNR